MVLPWPLRRHHARGNPPWSAVRTGLSSLIHYAYHRPGKPSVVYQQWLVLDRPDVKTLFLERCAGPPLTVGGAVIQEPDAPVIWFVFPDKWYDVGRFHLADGRFTGWYTNLTKPVEIRGDRWSATDLFLDLWTPASGQPLWLDQDELERATRERALDRATRQRVDNERALIDFQVKLAEWPPQITRDIDLVSCSHEFESARIRRLGSA